MIKLCFRANIRITKNMPCMNGMNVTIIDLLRKNLIDHLQFFIKIEFLAWIDNPMYAESNGASFMKGEVMTSTIFM